MRRRIFYSLFIIGLLVSTYYSFRRSAKEQVNTMLARIEGMDTSAWVGSSPYQIPVETESGKLIRYGYELIAHTAKYLGPKGNVQQTTNGMNCQNCHLEAGTKPWGLNYGSVYTTYPKFRERSGSMETIFKRVNDCME